MLAISQSGTTYHYMNWIPSESGPLVTHYGSIDKNVENPDKIDEHYLDVFDSILNLIDIDEPICTFSLDSDDLLFSTCYRDEKIPDMIEWHLSQSIDSKLNKVVDFYHYNFTLDSEQVLNIGVPKFIRNSFQKNMNILKTKLNGIGIGIFSAEVGARQWMSADKLTSYLIWKVGKKKNDQFLYIENGELVSYFSYHRTPSGGKLNWCFGDNKSIEKIIDDLMQLQDAKTDKFKSIDQVYIYTADGSIKDVQSFNAMGIKNLNLLNPLTILSNAIDESINEYDSLGLAETGNSFGGVDV
tara:strand:+ start:449 stop:1342 length:894 start_codon:yes stop_codon:yes gene_type:complete